MAAIQDHLTRTPTALPSAHVKLAGAEATSSPQTNLSFVMRMMIYATVGVFYLSNAYLSNGASPLTILTTLKWIPLGCLGMMCFAKASQTPFLAPNLGAISILLFPCLASVFVSDETTHSAAYFLGLTAVVLTGQVIAMQLSSARQFQAFTDIIRNIGLVLIAVSAGMWVLGLNWGRGAPRFTGWADNPNTLGLMLSPILTILFAGLLQTRRRWMLIDAPFMVVGLFLLAETQSRASMLWVGTSAAALLFGRRLRLSSLCIALCGIAIAFSFWHQIESEGIALLRHHEKESTTAEILSGRTEQWDLGLSLFAERPWLGYGLGTSESLIAEREWVFIQAEGDAFHNSYMTILVETGLLGLTVSGAFFLLSLFSGFVTLQRTRGVSRAEWVNMALPWAITLGALAHGFFESWLLSPGNANGMLFWSFFFVMRKGGMRFTLTSRRPEALQPWR